MITSELTDPGDGERLDLSHRREIKSVLREAAKAGEPLLLVVRGDAWAHESGTDEPTDAAATSADQHGLLRTLHGLDVPAVAFVEGQLRGLGLALALACDVRLLGPDATVVVDPVGTPGLMASGLPALLDHRAGPPAHDLLWVGASLSAEQAVSRSLATAVVDGADDAGDAVAGLARAGSALKRSLRADTAAPLARRLEYDAWLATVADTLPEG